MRNLLQETLAELWTHKTGFLKAFWPVVVLMPAVTILGGLVYYSFFSVSNLDQPLVDGELWITILVATVVIAFGVAPSAVRWHRLVIADENVRWLPQLPSVKLWGYTLKLIAVGLGFGAFSKIFESIWSDLLMPIMGLVLGPTWSGFDLKEDFVSRVQAMPLKVIAATGFDIVGIVSIYAVFVWVFGELILSLPEGAMDKALRGASTNWPPGGKRKFVGALLVLFAFPAVVGSIVMNLVLMGSSGAWRFLLVGPLTDLFCCIIGVTLLSVAYRRNLETKRAAVEGQ
jgi:hypothetical protein